MVSRVDWLCPACNRHYSIPAVSPLPNLCPKCDPAQANRKIPDQASEPPACIPPQNPIGKHHQQNSPIYLIMLSVATGLIMVGFAAIYRMNQDAKIPRHSPAFESSISMPELKRVENPPTQRSVPPEVQQHSGKGNDGTASLSASTVFRKPQTLVELVKEIEPAVVRITFQSVDGGGVGSGFLVCDGQTIITNYHVIRQVHEATVTFPNGKSIKIVGSKGIDKERDLAILHLEKPAHAQPLSLAAELPEKGADVIAFGSPQDLSFSVSQGIVSSLRNVLELQIVFGTQRKGTWIQTTAPISPGNSGGPLINMYGEVIGANSFSAASAESQNLNFAISSLDIADLLERSKSLPVVPLSPTTLPEPDQTPASFDIVDYSGTEKGNEMLRQLDQLTIRFTDPINPGTLGLRVMIDTELKRVLYSVGFTPIDEILLGKPVLVCIISPMRSRTGRNLHTIYLAIVKREVENGRDFVIKLYEDEHVLTHTTPPRHMERSLRQFMDSTKKRLAAIRKVTPSMAAEKLKLFDQEERAAAKLILARQFIENGKADQAVYWLHEIRDPNKGYPGTKAATEAGKQLATLPALDAETESQIDLRTARRLVDVGELETALWYYREICTHWPSTKAAVEAKTFLDRFNDSN